jgi:hypothetical protein
MADLQEVYDHLEDRIDELVGFCNKLQRRVYALELPTEATARFECVGCAECDTPCCVEFRTNGSAGDGTPDWCPYTGESVLWKIENNH